MESSYRCKLFKQKGSYCLKTIKIDTQQSTYFKLPVTYHVCSNYEFALYINCKHNGLSRDHNHWSELIEPELSGLRYMFYYIYVFLEKTTPKNDFEIRYLVHSY